ncbi:hypothetical protein EVA_07915 [gut metagenome]|uniref:Uncharacterized protein n=1 Tax=gut metagenome TaxID=749906 RepID=J9GAU7_9ZZZZ
MNDEDTILGLVANVKIQGFFITTEISVTGNTMPLHIRQFLHTKHTFICQGASGRKFVYKEGGWRLVFTFFPTDRVVDERYALKNKVQFHRGIKKQIKQTKG